MTQQHGSTSNAVAAAAAAAAAAPGVGWQGRAGGGGLLSAMEELLKHVKEVEAKQALEVAKRKTAEAERDVALTKLRAAQEEVRWRMFATLLHVWVAQGVKGSTGGLTACQQHNRCRLPLVRGPGAAVRLASLVLLQCFCMRCLLHAPVVST
jgi:hypothetical protein